MKGGHDQIKSRCSFYSKFEGVAEEFGGEVGELGGKASPPPAPPVDETLLASLSPAAKRIPGSYPFTFLR